MKNDVTQSNKPSNSQAGSVPDRHQSGQASHKQQQMSKDPSTRKSTDSKQQGVADQGSGHQQQADTGNSNDRLTSPSRDQGTSPSGSSNAQGHTGRPDNSPRQTGKN